MSMKKAEPYVVITNGALDEIGNGDIILRGVVLSDTLRLLKTDAYQREAMPLTSLQDIMSALENGEALPDIELGMRGQNFKEVAPGRFVLRDDVYIVDGQQRTNAAIHHIATHPDANVHLGATVHFSTTESWERDRFHTLNTQGIKVSPNVILRNRADTSTSMRLLYDLCTKTTSFTLHGRVCWKQRMVKGELVTALTLAKTVGLLHGHKAPSRRNKIDELVPALDKAVDLVGIMNMRDNIRTFFSLLDECWGVRHVQYREGASYLRGNFLNVLARILSDHYDFWQDEEERKLFVEASLRRKLAQFPVTQDPNIVNLASSGGKSREILYVLLRDHLNRGKRAKRLRSRNGDLISVDEEDEEVTPTSADQ